jgi:uncharacterized protein (DUF362 family)/NAD-dependent dihydropyrimidine dehydrogenase PreA subunit
LLKQDNYDYAAIRRAVEELLAPLGGMGAFVKTGDNVLLKPNLVMSQKPDGVALTHPAVVGAVAELALDCGGKVRLGDSPGLGSARKVAESYGLAAVADRLGVEIVQFTPVDDFDESRTYKRLTLARELLEADVVINLPKLKTHAQMFMTMAVKNLFGAVVGAQKFQWHYRAGSNKQAFAKTLYEVYAAVKPALHVVDAVVAMDGNGPTSGKPNPTNFLAAGTDGCAVDAVLLDCLGLERDSLPVLLAAREAGDIAWEKVETVGASPAELRPARWDQPESVTIEMIAPRLSQKYPFLTKWLRSQFTAVPYAIPGKCVMCGACVRLCPAQAMTLVESVKIDKSKCIRCYCCHELCPHDAMGLRQGFLGRMLGMFKSGAGSRQ